MAFIQLNKGIDSAGAVHPVLTDGSGRTKISHGQPAPISGTLGVLNAQVAVESDGFSDVIFYFTGTTVQTVTFEQSPDSTNGTNGLWFPVLAVNQGVVAVAAVTAALTTNATYRISAPAGAWIRVRTSAYTSGSMGVQAVTTSAMAQPQVTSMPGGTQATTLATTSIGALATVIGQTMFRDIAVTNTDVAIKAAINGRLYSYYLQNPGTGDTWVHFYNALIANVTVGTTVPVWSVYVPPGGTAEREFMIPLSFPVGLTVAATTSSLHTVSTAPGTAVVVEVGYI